MRIHPVRPARLLLALLGTFVLGMLVASSAAGSIVSTKIKKESAIRAEQADRHMRASRAASRAAKRAAEERAKKQAAEDRRRAALARRKAAEAKRRAHAAREGAFRARVSRYGLSWPRADIITSPFGPRRTFGGGFHHGVDILCGPKGLDPIYAAGNGRVVLSATLPIYGNAVFIQHNNKIKTVYAHLSSSWVRPGQRVKRGQAIGRCGTSGRSTAPHLHFEVHTPAGAIVNPLKALPPR